MIATLARREQAEAYADLYEVPMVEVYRRYGAVLLRGSGTGCRSAVASVAQKEAESGR